MRSFLRFVTLNQGLSMLRTSRALTNAATAIGCPFGFIWRCSLCCVTVVFVVQL